MMAVLTSGGFSGLGHDGLDALTPLLDLLNHVRGGADNMGKELVSEKKVNRHHAEKKCQHDATAKSRGVPDVRYEMYEEDAGTVDCAGPSSPERKRLENGIHGGGTGRGGVCVRTSHPSLHIGSTLQMTYGAKENVAFGFCILNNVEPDGESLLSYDDFSNIIH